MEMRRIVQDFCHKSLVGQLSKVTIIGQHLTRRLNKVSVISLCDLKENPYQILSDIVVLVGWKF